MSEPWYSQAACHGATPNLFFRHEEVRSASEKVAAVRAARAVCETCPVRRECLVDAMTEEGNAPHGRAGIRAGLTAEQRDALHKRGGYDGVTDPVRLWRTRTMATGGSRA